jgi:hypothetical protein
MPPFEHVQVRVDGSDAAALRQPCDQRLELGRHLRAASERIGAEGQRVEEGEALQDG